MAIARVALPVGAWQLFDYWIPDGLSAQRGDVVRVRLGARTHRGVVIAVDSASDFLERLHPVESVCEGERLPADIMELADFTSSYYQSPPGLAYSLVTSPASLRRSSPDEADTSNADARHPDPFRHALNDAQSHALAMITAAASTFAPLLLHGVTGSGKTDVYLAATEAVIRDGGQTLILVPEINLTPQFEQRVRASLPGVRAVTLHSRLAAGARRTNWVLAAGGDAHVEIGRASCRERV